MTDGSKVAVIGGGPAGSFFALHLLEEAACRKLELDVEIIEKRRPLGDGPGSWLCHGCNSCAGGISPRLNSVLKTVGISLPEEVIEADIERVWLQSLWKNFPFKVPADMRMCTVFRGTLPSKRGARQGGLDAFLLEEAVRRGARITQGEVLDIDRSSSGRLDLALRHQGEKESALTADLVVIASGVNSGPSGDGRAGRLMASVSELVPKFRPAQTRRALVLEIEVGRGYLDRYMSGEVYFIEHGLKELSLEHIALVPKESFLTITLVGRLIDRADLPSAGMDIAGKLLGLREVAAILPNVSASDVACACAPNMAVAPARHPFGSRLALVGDAVGSRLYKDGLYSAFRTARALARTVLREGVDEASIARGYGETVRWLAEDNRYGRMVFAVSRILLGSPLVSRVLYQAFATELKTRDKTRRPLGMVLWHIASGISDYRDVFRQMFRLRTLRSLAAGLLVTIRNRATEAFFGLRWGYVGRYPTVIAKEKRGAVKAALESTLDIRLDSVPDFEKMYVIKIRGEPSDLFRELGKFGERSRRYFQVRLVDVRRIAGAPNEVGSIIRYQGWPLPVKLDMFLEKAITDRGLYYRVSERFADRGKLIFDINRTKDGNSRLVIYTAFQFKRGSSMPARLFWNSVKWLFPRYLHDVVWNHALCCIKAEIEASARPL